MSQATVTDPSAAPATPPPAPPVPPVTPPAATPPATAPAASAPPEAPAEKEPNPTWLTGRLEQARTAERKRLLAELGAKDADEAKAILAKAKQEEDARKSELQRAKEEAEALRSKAAKADSYEATIRAHADTQLAALTDEQRAIVADVVGDDPAEILKKLPVLKKGWATAATPPAPAAKPPVPAPASTTAATPPPAAATPPPSDHLAVYERLKEGNPLAATAYFEKHKRTICSQIDARRKK